MLVKNYWQHKGRQNMAKSDWRQRAKEGLDKTARFAAEHGSAIGLSSAAILGTGAAGCMLVALGADAQDTTALYREASSTFLLAALLKGGFWIGAQEAARGFLGVQAASQFDAEWENTAKEVSASKRGAVPVTDDPTRGPEFQTALQAVMKNLESRPEAKAFLIDILKSSPDARESLINTTMRAPGNRSSAVLEAVETMMKPGARESDPEPDSSLKPGTT
jgi:hypothetical protein